MQKLIASANKNISIFINDIELGAVNEIEFSDENRCEHIFSYGETVAEIISNTQTHTVYLSRLIVDENYTDIFSREDFTLSIAFEFETVHFFNCQWVKCTRKIGVFGNIIENAVIAAKSKEVTANER